MNQLYSSKSTSVNSKTAPTAFRKCCIEPDEIILDYGCGKYPEKANDVVFEKGAFYVGYDPYNLHEEKNVAALLYVAEHPADRVFCCNVLNVLDDETMLKVIEHISTLVCPSSKVYFQIYEGDRSGTIKINRKRQSLQRNQITLEYMPFIARFFKYVTRKGNIITACNSKYIDL